MDYEVRPTRKLVGDTIEVCQPNEAHQYSVYKNLPDGLQLWIADFSKERLAKQYVDFKNKT